MKNHLVDSVSQLLHEIIEEKYTSFEFLGGTCTIRHLQVRDAEGAPPVVFIPGIGGFAESFFYNLKDLANHGFYPIAVDNVGFGGSHITEDIEFFPELFPKALSIWFEKAGLENAFLIGNSFGGGVALGLWQYVKDKVRGVGLISSAGFGKEVWFAYKIASLPVVNFLSVRLAINKRINATNITRGWKSIVHDFKKIPDFIIEYDVRYKNNLETRRAYEYILKNFLTIKGQNELAMNEIQQIAKELKQHNVPVLVVWGKDDKILPVSHATIAAELTGGKIHILEKCGHLPYLEKWKEVNDILVDFIIHHKNG